MFRVETRCISDYYQKFPDKPEGIHLIGQATHWMIHDIDHQANVYDKWQLKEILEELLNPHTPVTDPSWPLFRIVKPHNFIDSGIYHWSVPIPEHSIFSVGSGSTVVHGLHQLRTSIPGKEGSPYLQYFRITN